MQKTSDAPALVVEAVTKTFSSGRSGAVVTAVDGLSFCAQRGEVLALLGPNGAGKTTTIDMCEGFTRPSSGRIRVLGLDPSTQPEALRARIGIMLQGGGSYSGIRVREMLELTARYNVDPLDPDWLIDLLGLRGVERTTYRRLSGGQQQRLSLALALIGRPELVFLDEPTAGMDAQSRIAVWEIIGALKRDGVTVVLTTHLMDEAEALADHVVIVDHGRVVGQGSPAELTAREEVPSVSILTDRELDLVALGRALEGRGVDTHKARPLRYRVSGGADPGIVASIAAEAQRQGVLLRELSVTHRTLEDVFLDMTGRELRS
ncbi:ABC transporter ATP-binding protein [Corynebacterium liangguodongii]|uniref:Spermidine/putrescine ABC transporter ATP-binding protein n=1 Tax=Corynebacterium liangguodongii TaxID=2079535 RepID=A0A2S0WE50_9CORY|nr:ABC transporter ATP-binding protein [Corynebacterium liangguodongii]AWB84046.1 spermidine/putrescine ABC transporter ATP-binding protein [Corynebacterium liangguodongii]PWC00057.1 ABC transporter ATP-binding protein [Corynebacterium liangguodongii]